MEPAEKNLPDSLVESISMPDIPTSGLKIADWSPGTLVTYGDYMTAQSYLEMVRLKIERHKKYPDIARIKNIEGSVVVRFVITPEGGVWRSQKAPETMPSIWRPSGLCKMLPPFQNRPGVFLRERFLWNLPSSLSSPEGKPIFQESTAQ